MVRYAGNSNNQEVKCELSEGNYCVNCCSGWRNKDAQEFPGGSGPSQGRPVKYRLKCFAVI